MKILLVEDEIFLANTIIKNFKNNNINVECEYDGMNALKLILENQYDIVILDIMLPGLDGISILKKVRANNNDVPIIITSAKGELDDKVLGLSLGADDYLAKPYDFKELFARVKANLRKTTPNLVVDSNQFGNVILDRNNLQLTTESKTATLTLKEFEIVNYLMQSYPNPISKDSLIEKVWGFDSDVLPNHVEVYISYVRKKLKIIKADFEIKTIRNIGYKVEMLNV